MSNVEPPSAPHVLEPTRNERAAMRLLRQIDIAQANVRASYLSGAKAVTDRMKEIRAALDNHMQIHRKVCLMVRTGDGESGEVVWVSKQNKYERIDVDRLKTGTEWLLREYLCDGRSTEGLEKHQRVRVGGVADASRKKKPARPKPFRKTPSEWATHYAACVMVHVSNERKREFEGGVTVSRAAPPMRVQQMAQSISATHSLCKDVVEYLALSDKLAKMRDRRKKWMDIINSHRDTVNGVLVDFFARAKTQSYPHFVDDESDIIDVTVDIKAPVTDMGERREQRFQEAGVTILPLHRKPKKKPLLIKDYKHALTEAWHPKLDATRAKRTEYTEKELHELGVFRDMLSGMDQFVSALAQEVDGIRETKIGESPPPEVRLKLNKLNNQGIIEHDEEEQDEDDEDEDAEDEGNGA